MSRSLRWAWDRKEKACTVCKQKSVVRILSSPVYRLCDLGSYELSCPVKQGFGKTTSQAHWEAQMRERSQKFLHHPPLCWLVLSVLMLGGKVTSHSQIPTSARLWRLKTPGVAEAQVPPSLISGDLKPWGRQPGFSHGGLHGCTSLCLSDWPGARSGMGNAGSLGLHLCM